MTAPAWGDILPLTGKWEELPDTTTPYYVVAKEGTFIHRKVAFGRGVFRHTKTPKKLQPVGNYTGMFLFDTQHTIPAEVVKPIVAFFRRIWNTHKTEAEVILTQHRETGQYRVYIPFQSVSTGHVHSIYDPTTIDPMYLVVGTMHSHCNFSAFHSSTDEGDARDMDGMHFTVGHIDRDVPEVAAMVAINGTFVHYKDYETLADFSTVSFDDMAPEWWDRYVYIGPLNDAPRPKWASDEMWEKFLGKKKAKPPTKIEYKPWRGSEDRFDDAEWGFPNYGYLYNRKDRAFTPLRESTEFNRRHVSPKWDKATGALLPDEGDYWEDALGKDFVDRLFSTQLFTEDDLSNALKDWPLSGTEDYWEGAFKDKLLRCVAFLRSCGYDVKVNLTDPRPVIVEGQTSIDDMINGVI